MGEAVSYLLRRNGKYLSEVYQWGATPNAFAECYFQDVLDEAMNYPDPPLEIGEIVNGDLDAVQWMKIEGLTISPESL